MICFKETLFLVSLYIVPLRFDHLLTTMGHFGTAYVFVGAVFSRVCVDLPVCSAAFAAGVACVALPPSSVLVRPPPRSCDTLYPCRLRTVLGKNQ